MPDAPASTPTLWTIGHSNHTLERFTDLLRVNHIDTLIDVRTSPYSKYAQHFAKEVLAVVLPRSNITYHFLGKELGGRPTGSNFYDPEGHVLYVELARSPLFLDGITRLERELLTRRCAIMCSEEDPAVCHRHLLVARVLYERNPALGILNIRSDSRLETFTHIEAQAKALEGRSETLFGEEVRHPWRSLRSVSQAATPGDSSAI